MVSTDRVKTLLVDDHEVVRRGLIALLTEVLPSVDVVATATNAEETLQVVTTHSLDLIIMDIRLVGSKQHGLDLTEDLNMRFPDLAIVIYSADTNIELVRRAQEAGARGYINKNDGSEIIKQAIEKVANGGTHFPKLPREIEPPTQGEKKVMKLLAKDKDDSEISTELDITGATVRTHCRNIMSKLDLHNRLELRREARKRYPPDLDR